MDLSSNVVEKSCFQENKYGSKLTVSIQDGCVIGTYSPPAPLGSNGSPAVLKGELRKNSVIRGHWTHGQGPLTAGLFEVVDAGNGCYTGWWAEGSADPESASALHRQPWSWIPDAARDLQDALGECSQAVCSQAVAPPQATESPLARLADFCASVHMERFTMFASWLFFMQTAVQLVAALWAPAMLNAHLNFAFNIVFSLLYLFFLGVYACLKLPPSAAFVSGVVLYFAGYVAFAVLYGLAAAGLSSSPAWYHLGAWCFLLGSALLVRATKTAWCSPLRHESALFWGSVSFLVGSVFFVLDDAHHTAGLVPVGLALFMSGRLFFVRGSQTVRCDVLLRDPCIADGLREALLHQDKTLLLA